MIDRIRVPIANYNPVFIICEIMRDIGLKSQFFITRAFEAAVRGSCRNIAIRFGTEKTTIVWLPDGKNI